MKRTSIVIGIILIVATATWHFRLGDPWTYRIGPDWSWSSNFIGINTIAEPGATEFPERDAVATYERSNNQVTPGGWNRQSVEIYDFYETRDPVTDKVNWINELTATLDPKTAKYLTEEHRGMHFVFPRWTERKTYVVRQNSPFEAGLPMVFEGEETIEGLLAYVYSYSGAATYTEAYASKGDFAGVDVLPGQEIRCSDDQLKTRIWVEPVTGEHLKNEEGCLSGDWVFDIATGERLFPLTRWRGYSAGDDVLLRADRIRVERRKFLWASRYLPLLLTLLGIAALVYAMLPGRSDNTQ